MASKQTAPKQSASKQSGKKTGKQQAPTKGKAGPKATQPKSASGSPPRGARAPKVTGGPKTKGTQKVPKPPVDPARLHDVVAFTTKTRWGIHEGRGTVVKLPYTDDEHQHRLVVRVDEDELAHPFPSQCRIVKRAPSAHTSATKPPAEPFFKEIGK